MCLERVFINKNTRLLEKVSSQDGSSKQQVSNLFNSQEALGNISSLAAIEKFSGARNGKIRADFYDDCQDIPDPSALDPMQNNLSLLGDCFLGKQNKAEAYYTRGRRNNCDTIYIAQNYFRLPRHTIRENSNFVILFPQDVNNLTDIHVTICAIVIYPSWDSNSFVIGYGARNKIL